MMKMDSTFRLEDAEVIRYREDGYVHLHGVLSGDEVDYFVPLISDAVVDLNTIDLPMDERSTYDKAFLQVTNLWRKEESVIPLVFSRRLAEIAATLLGVDSVRIYHDQALFKEPGGGITPWHADQYYWPLATSKCVTAWIPLQDTPLKLGPLEFSPRSHLLREGRDLAIGNDSEAFIDTLLADRKGRHVVEPFQKGDVSFHSGWLFHRAGPNRSSEIRKVMCVIYMDSEMRLKQPDNDHQVLDMQVWCPGIEVGSIIDSELNPVLYP